MRITKKSAQQIVEEIGKLVRQNINLMDETGHIIASNDPARIGKFHEGAYRIISQHLPEFYITPELENELPDVRRGINLPIVVDGQLQGVIGITGDYDAVIEYGQIVKKMAEILIRERSELDNRQLDLRVRSRFLEDWILGTGLSNPRMLSERGFALGIDIRSPRRCIVASARDREKYTDSLDGQMILEKIDRALNARIGQQGGILLRNAARQILLVRKQSTEKMVALCRTLSREIRQELDVEMIFGIDGPTEDLHEAYLQANRAWHTTAYSNTDIRCYEALNIELLMDDVSRDRKQAYLKKVFRNCGNGEIAEQISLLEAFFSAEGSVQAISQALFIHKNTVQYRIKRLAELTGLDVRQPSQAPALYLAMLFYLELSRSEEGRTF